MWGKMATGRGHAPLTEPMAVIGIPVMTKKAFMMLKKKWWTILEGSMKEAGVAEKAITISRAQ